MQLHPWIIASWPIIERAVGPAPEIATDLQHLGTTVSADCDDYGRLRGNTFWGGTDSGIGIAWDWIEAIYGIGKMQFGSNATSERGDLKDHGVVTGYFATTN